MHRNSYCLTNSLPGGLVDTFDNLFGGLTNVLIFNSIQFSLFPAHINISYNIDNVHIMCRKRGGLKTVLMNVHPQTLTVVNY